MASNKATFNWEDPLFLDSQLSEAAARHCATLFPGRTAAEVLPRVRMVFRNEGSGWLVVTYMHVMYVFPYSAISNSGMGVSDQQIS